MLDDWIPLCEIGGKIFFIVFFIGVVVTVISIYQ